MNCDFKVNQIPCGIQVEYNKNIDEKPIKHFEHLDNTDVSILMPNNRYVKYSIETGDTVPNEHKFETVFEYYYTNYTLGCKFKVKHGMCDPRIDPKKLAVLFHNNIDGDYYIYTVDGILIDMISGYNLIVEYHIDMVYRFEFHGTYSLLYSKPEDETIIIYDHINKIISKFVCYGKLFEYIHTIDNDNLGQDLYITITRSASEEVKGMSYNKCDLITVNIDDPSNFEVVTNVHNFKHEFDRYFITKINDQKILVAVDGYNVEIYEFTSRLSYITSFKLKYMADLYDPPYTQYVLLNRVEKNQNTRVGRSPGDHRGATRLGGSKWREVVYNNSSGDICDNFICVHNGKLYYDNSDGVIMHPKDSIRKNEFMAIDLNYINPCDGSYTPIPLFDLISDEHQELITTYYDNQPIITATCGPILHDIIKLTVLDDKYVLEFPDKKFVMVDMR